MKMTSSRPIQFNVEADLSNLKRTVIIVDASMEASHVQLDLLIAMHVARRHIGPTQTHVRNKETVLDPEDVEVTPIVEAEEPEEAMDEAKAEASITTEAEAVAEVEVEVEVVEDNEVAEENIMPAKPTRKTMSLLANRRLTRQPMPWR